MRFYYKTTDGKGWVSLKTPDYNGNATYTPITEQEFNAHLSELEAKRLLKRQQKHNK